MNVYHLTNRPVGIGTYPDRIPDGNGGWRPVEATILSSHYPPTLTPTGWNDYGSVGYAEPLPYDRIWQFDLLPADPVEAARYGLWVYAERDAERAADILDSYRRLEREQLRRRSVNPASVAAMVLTIITDEEE